MASSHPLSLSSSKTLSTCCFIMTGGFLRGMTGCMRKGQKQLKLAAAHPWTWDLIGCHKLGGGASSTNDLSLRIRLKSCVLFLFPLIHSALTYTHVMWDIFAYGNHEMVTILVGKLGILTVSKSGFKVESCPWICSVCLSSNRNHTKNKCRFKVFADYEAYVKCQEKVSQLYMVSMGWVSHRLLRFIHCFLYVKFK